jgi:hypothetical protein
MLGTESIFTSTVTHYLPKCTLAGQMSVEIIKHHCPVHAMSIVLPLPLPRQNQSWMAAAFDPPKPSDLLHSRMLAISALWAPP